MNTSVPTLVPGSQVLQLDDGSVAVRTWHRTIQIRGSHADTARRVLEAIDGGRDGADIAKHAGLEDAIVQAVLGRLHDSGVVQLRDRHDPPVELSQRDTLDLASGARPSNGADAGVQQGRVLVVGAGAAAGLVADRLRGLGGRVVEAIASPAQLAAETDPCAGLVYAEERMTFRDALDVDSHAAATATPWCAGWWEGTRLVVTHEIRFGRSACFACLLDRQRANYIQPEVDIPLEMRLRNGTTTTAGEDTEGTVPTLLSSLLADLLVLRTRSLLSSPPRSKRPRQLAELDLATWELRWSTVLRLPSCRRCSPGVLHLSRAMA